MTDRAPTDPDADERLLTDLALGKPTEASPLRDALRKDITEIRRRGQMVSYGLYDRDEDEGGGNDDDR